MMKLSLIVPCYNEEDNILPFYNEVSKTFKDQKIKVELIFINDGSKDNTIKELKKLTTNNDFEIKIIDFSRNFGKEAGMYAGMEHSTGDYVSIIDVDLQQPPKIVLDMLEILEKDEDYDAVAAYQVKRKDPFLKKHLSNMFYKVINKVADVEFKSGASDFRLLRKKVVDSILEVHEYYRFSKGIFGWIGFRTYWMPYENVERVAGKTKWNFWGLFGYAIDGIVNFSHVPLDIASWFGILMTMVSFLAIAFIVIRKLLFGDPVAGWASTACIITFIGGIQLLCLGIIGKYLATVYLEVKKRPHYIISESSREDVKKVG